jgi:hypothetical protein
MAVLFQLSMHTASSSQGSRHSAGSRTGRCVAAPVSTGSLYRTTAQTYRRHSSSLILASYGRFWRTHQPTVSAQLISHSFKELFKLRTFGYFTSYDDAISKSVYFALRDKIMNSSDLLYPHALREPITAWKSSIRISGRRNVIWKQDLPQMMQNCYPLDGYFSFIFAIARPITVPVPFW